MNMYLDNLSVSELESLKPSIYEKLIDLAIAESEQEFKIDEHVKNKR